MWHGCVQGTEAMLSFRRSCSPALLALEPSSGSACSLQRAPRARTGAPDARALGADEARALAGELAAALAARELQLERKQQEVAAMHDVQQRLMARRRGLMIGFLSGLPPGAGSGRRCRARSDGSSPRRGALRRAVGQLECMAWGSSHDTARSRAVRQLTWAALLPLSPKPR
jgi:hypothetical protein